MALAFVALVLIVIAVVAMALVAVVVMAVFVLAGVVVLVAVTGVAVPLAVSVMLVALSVPVVGVVILEILPFVAGLVVVAAGRAVGVGLSADSGLGSRGDAPAGRSLRRPKCWAGRGVRGSRRTGRAVGGCRFAGAG